MNDLICAGCGAKLTGGGPYYWTCVCGRKLRRTEDGSTKEASPGYLAAVADIDAHNAECERRARTHMVRVGGSRGVKGRLVYPDTADVWFSDGCFMIFCAGFAGCAFIAWGRWWGISIAVLALAIWIWMLRVSQRRRTAYRRFKAEHAAHLATLEERLKSL
jgi:hypothetical protein